MTAAWPWAHPCDPVLAPACGAGYAALTWWQRGLWERSHDVRRCSAQQPLPWGVSERVWPNPCSTPVPGWTQNRACQIPAAR